MSNTDSPLPATSGPFKLEARCDLFAFGNALREAGYSAESIHSVLNGIVTHTRLDTAVLEYRTEEQTPFHTLFRLFLLGNPVAPAAVEKALGGFPVESLLTGGVLSMDKNGLQANARIDVWEDRYVFADFYKGGEVARLEHVLGTAEASSCLHKLTVRRAVTSALDVGTGGGCQALLLSSSLSG